MDISSLLSLNLKNCKQIFSGNFYNFKCLELEQIGLAACTFVM